LHSGRADGSEKGAIAVGLERLNRLVGQGGPRLLERFPASLVVREGELEAKRRRQGFEDAAARGDYFAADAVAGDEAWGMLVDHGSLRCTRHVGVRLTALPILKVRAAMLGM